MPERRTIGGLFFRWLTKLLLTAIACGIVFFAVIAVTDPWALHIGGRWTPFTWLGAGKLTTKSGAEYPLFVLFYLDNPAKANGSLEPSSPVQGMAWLCAAPGVAQVLQVDGGLDGAWVRSTEGRGMGLNLQERPVALVAPPPEEGSIHLHGTWHGPDLRMESTATQFRSGLRVEPGSTTLSATTLTWRFFRPSSLCSGAFADKTNPK